MVLEEKFYMAYSPQGNTPPRKQYKKKSEAYKACLDMIEKFPNQTFYVFEAVTLIKANIEIKSSQLLDRNSEDTL